MNQTRHLRLPALLLVVMLLLVSLPSLSVSADTVADKRQELAALQAEQKKIEASIKNLGTDIESKKTKVAQLNKQVTNLESQIDAYRTQISLLDKQIAEQNNRIDTLNGQITQKEKELAEILAKLKKRVKAITKTGNYSSFQMLFSTEDYTDYLLKSQVIKCVSEHDQALREQAEQEKRAINEAKTQVETEKQQTEADKAEWVTLKSDLDVKYNSLDSLYTTARNEQIALEKQLGTYEAKQAAIQKAEEELEKEINAMLSSTPASGTYKGSMHWPVPGINSISCHYGQMPTYFHGGTDIQAPGCLGRNIVAAADGVVIKVQKMHYSYGNFVMVDHGLDAQGKRIMTLYAHMRYAPSVAVGQTVVGGQTVLGKVGSTGNSTGPHLHFEVRVDGKRVNPEKGYIG